MTEVTSPTSTPAIRTGEGMWSSVLLVNTALSTNGEPPNGSRPAEHEVDRRSRSRARRRSPAARFETRGLVAPDLEPAGAGSLIGRLLGLQALSCLARCRSAGGPEYGSLPASHSAISPGESVFGYGLTCSGPCSVPRAGLRSTCTACSTGRLAAGDVVDRDQHEPQHGARGRVLRQRARRRCAGTASRSCMRTGPASGMPAASAGSRRTASGGRALAAPPASARRSRASSTALTSRGSRSAVPGRFSVLRRTRRRGPARSSAASRTRDAVR